LEVKGILDPRICCPYSFGFEKIRDSFANIRKPEFVGTRANPKIKDAFHTFKTDNAGGTPGRFLDFEKRLCSNFLCKYFCKLLHLGLFAKLKFIFRCPIQNVVAGAIRRFFTALAKAKDL